MTGWLETRDNLVAGLRVARANMVFAEKALREADDYAAAANYVRLAREALVGAEADAALLAKETE